jgi:tetratricopeptide (TPR) repeat protein
MHRSNRTALLVLAGAAVAASVAFGCRTGAGPGADSSPKPARLFDDLGTHSHPITTSSPRAQQWFDQGLRLAYGFNHDEARIAFYESTRVDPDCAMCWWGVAYTLGPNYNLPGDAERDREAWEAVQKAKAAAPKASERERAYVDAIAKRYASPMPADRRPLDEAWANGMGEVARRFPDDLDAATLHAESMMDLQPWDLWTHEGEPKGRTLEIVAELERVLAADPHHPGANHYYIHAVEASRTPERGTGAADRLRALDIQAGHLVHMPSHIYVRTGRYADATQANAEAMAVDEAYIQKWNVKGPYSAMYYPHNVHFRSFAASFEGRSGEALENARKVAGFLSTELMQEMPMLEGIAAAPLFVLVRFGRWDELIAEPAPPPQLRFLSALRHWARGVALTSTGRLRDADAEARAMAAVAAEVPGDRLATQVNTWKGMLGVASNHLAGVIAAKRGRTADAVKRLEAAVAAEDALVYMEPADWFVPVRGTLGAALLDAGRAKEAEAVYRADLEKYRENGWSLDGLARSLEKQGRAQEAAEARARFTKAWARADVTPALAPRTAQDAGAPVEAADAR